MRNLIRRSRERELQGNGWRNRSGRRGSKLRYSRRSRSCGVKAVKPFVDVVLQLYGRKRSSRFNFR
jgi:hypothetical protein